MCAIFTMIIIKCFACNRIYYVRYLYVCTADMTNMSSQHSEVYQEFLSGNFSVHYSKTNSFCCFPVYQTIKVAVNNTQTPGGTSRPQASICLPTKRYCPKQHADIQSTMAQMHEETICTALEATPCIIIDMKKTTEVGKNCC